MAKKALIDTQDIYTHRWISSWTFNAELNDYEPQYSQEENCVRVAQVEDEENIFETVPTLQWISCPDHVDADNYHYKDEDFHLDEHDVIKPE